MPAQLRALIETKLQGQPLAPPSAEEPAVLSLLAALEQSVAQTDPAGSQACQGRRWSGHGERASPEVRMTVPFLPMLAVPGEPFDGGDYLFEVKWNGVRALAANEHADWRLWGRELADYRWRYPELAVLRPPAGGDGAGR